MNHARSLPLPRSATPASCSRCRLLWSADVASRSCCRLSVRAANWRLHASIAATTAWPSLRNKAPFAANWAAAAVAPASASASASTSTNLSFSAAARAAAVLGVSGIHPASDLSPSPAPIPAARSSEFMRCPTSLPTAGREVLAGCVGLPSSSIASKSRLLRTAPIPSGRAREISIRVGVSTSPFSCALISAAIAVCILLSSRCCAASAIFAASSSLLASSAAALSCSISMSIARCR